MELLVKFSRGHVLQDSIGELSAEGNPNPMRKPFRHDFGSSDRQLPIGSNSDGIGRRISTARTGEGRYKMAVRCEHVVAENLLSKDGAPSI
jgi:hypothetical protein